MPHYRGRQEIPSLHFGAELNDGQADDDDDLPGGWVDHASTDDREVALGRYKSLAASNPRATRLIERTERVVVEGAPQRKRSR